MHVLKLIIIYKWAYRRLRATQLINSDIDKFVVTVHINRVGWGYSDQTELFGSNAINAINILYIRYEYSQMFANIINLF
jgi:hypothetical protein